MKVYFILDTASNAVKIGKANNIEQRMSDLQTGNPNPLKLIHEIECESEKQSFLLEQDRKSTRLNSSHSQQSRMPSSA